MRGQSPSQSSMLATPWLNRTRSDDPACSSTCAGQSAATGFAEREVALGMLAA
jgi:hypothetical protein